ncbi:flagellar transcriptional regulator FlhD [Trinickia violacea]|uniref:Flagellar transcriptional regulator FlhD n=2 Tax=Trinickia violacea TaxID=2571746 RepID=A0A4P8ILW0_9BURK|nr:flagellar transcriptional regulator FlhD [Trinickia violacea]
MSAPCTFRDNAARTISGLFARLICARTSKRFRKPDQLERLGGIMSATIEMLSEIKEVNLSYLLLAQRLLREDKAMGMFRMGISEQLADVLANLSLAQTVKLAASNQVLCRFRFDDHAILSSLADKGKANAVAQAHSAILMASQPAEALG